MSDITLGKLKQEGALQNGDKITCERLGDCVVVSIYSAGTIDVRRILDNRYYRISGLAV